MDQRKNSGIAPMPSASVRTAVSVNPVIGGAAARRNAHRARGFPRTRMFAFLCGGSLQQSGIAKLSARG